MNDPRTEFIYNALLSRAAFYSQITDGRYNTRNIDKECGYPDYIGIEDYIKMYRRNDVAARVVDVEPNECWKEYPDIYETEEERETEFEKSLDKVAGETNLYAYLARADRISGIGRFGVLFIGLDDGEAFSTPAPGYDEHDTLPTPGKAKVLYYRVFDESAAQISQYEEDKANKRYGQPLYYTLTFAEAVSSLISDGGTVQAQPTTTQEQVHWSRCIHLADGLHTSEIFGTPRMENVYNRLMDLRKINGGAGEMFYKGGFPGYHFNVDPKDGELSDEDIVAARQDVKNWSEGLDRYLMAVGMDVKSMAPQVADPTNAVNNCLKIIATTKGIPMRLLTGSEQGHLASTQDSETWVERVALRRNMYVTPYIIRPTVDRLRQYGAVASPESSPGESAPKAYTVKWRPLATMTETERAEVGKNITEALARYATSGAEALIPLPEFLSKVLKISFQEVEAIMKAPKTEFSVVFRELGMSGAAGGNVPSSIPNMSKSKDPNKTPKNKVQPSKSRGTVEKKQTSPQAPPSVQE